jgi:general secretion pathway protein C
MQSKASPGWEIKLVTFVLSALAAASAAYWGLKGSGSAAPVVAAVALAPAVPTDPLVVARALGGGVANLPAAAPVVTGSRYALAGVVANTTQGGAALISVDGKPARPVRVGAQVDGTLLLQSVSGRRAVLAPDLHAPAAVTLELPSLTR